MSNEWENKKFKGIHYSRIIASWFGDWKTNWKFQEWLRNLEIEGEKLPEDVIMDIYNLGTNGKMELETNAKMFKKVIDKGA